MQLGFQSILKPNKQVLEIYIGVKFEIIGHAPGLAFGLLLRATVRRALGRVLTPLLLGLIWLLLRCLYHLIHDVLNGGCYTNAYEIIECSSMM